MEQFPWHLRRTTALKNNKRVETNSVFLASFRTSEGEGLDRKAKKKPIALHLGGVTWVYPIALDNDLCHCSLEESNKAYSLSGNPRMEFVLIQA